MSYEGTCSKVERVSDNHVLEEWLAEIYFCFSMRMSSTGANLDHFLQKGEVDLCLKEVHKLVFSFARG